VSAILLTGRTEFRGNRDFDLPHFKGGKITADNFVENLDETLILIPESQWDELIDSLIHYDGAKSKDLEDKQSDGTPFFFHRYIR
jgi:hypothetical protein